MLNVISVTTVNVLIVFAVCEGNALSVSCHMALANTSVGSVSFQLDLFRSFNLSYGITWYEVNMLPSVSLSFRLLKLFRKSCWFSVSLVVQKTM